MGKSRSHTDQAAIFQHVFNEELGALEVIIVGSKIPELKMGDITQSISVDTSKMESQLQKLVDSNKSPDVQIVYVDKIIVQKEIQIVEIPTIVVQEKFVEVIKEVVREVSGPSKLEVVTVTVEKEVPVIVTKTEYKDLSKLLIVGLVLQGLMNVIVALLHK